MVNGQDFFVIKTGQSYFAGLMRRRREEMVRYI